MTDLVQLGADVEWTDSNAAATARAHARPGMGRLAELAEWLAATQGGYPVRPLRRVRCLVLGEPDARVLELAAALDVGVTSVVVPADPQAAFTAGTGAADAEVEAGADLVVLAAHDPEPVPAVIVGLVTRTEPVGLLPRGAAATDTVAWIARAAYLRDMRRRVVGLRGRPQELFAALESPLLAAATGLALRTVARRTPLVLDGTAAVAAALLGYDVQARAGRWWRVADSSADPVHAKAIDHLAQQPLLDLATTSGDGTAGVLAVALLRAAAALAVEPGTP